MDGKEGSDLGSISLLRTYTAARISSVTFDSDEPLPLSLKKQVR